MQKAIALSALLGAAYGQQMVNLEEPQLTQVTDEKIVKMGGNGANPFEGRSIFANPTFQANVDKTIQDHPEIKDKLEKVRNIGAATWIDNMANIAKMEPVLKAAQGKQDVVMFVIYDLPNRDCDAGASNGEITCEDSNCAQGLNTYKTQYVDKVVEILKKYPTVNIVAIIEPDSLPNLATNMGNPKCSQGANAYKQGVEYTLKQMATLSHVTSYLDIAHGGWLGWDNNLQKIMPIFQEVLNNAGGPGVIRGFASNTANYQALGSMSSSADPCNLKSQYNFAIDEIHYMNLFDQKAQQHGMGSMYYITDTSRNGVSNERGNCSNWCNIKGAGLGMRPSTEVSSLGFNKLDAVTWIKTPGESDGTTDTSGRFDPMCRSSDSQIPAPEAGEWFEDFFVTLVNNAQPPIS
jgi:cellulose 1,4-beta-cellobiosidase